MVFVKVLVDFGHFGDMEPVSITWPDGRVFQVDRVLDVEIAPAKSGGSGIRYLCRILNREVRQYFNESTGQWWMDGRE